MKFKAYKLELFIALIVTLFALIQGREEEPLVVNLGKLQIPPGELYAYPYVSLDRHNFTVALLPVFSHENGPWSGHDYKLMTSLISHLESNLATKAISMNDQVKEQFFSDVRNIQEYFYNEKLRRALIQDTKFKQHEFLVLLQSMSTESLLTWNYSKLKSVWNILRREDKLISTASKMIIFQEYLELYLNLELPGVPQMLATTVKDLLYYNFPVYTSLWVPFIDARVYILLPKDVQNSILKYMTFEFDTLSDDEGSLTHLRLYYKSSHITYLSSPTTGLVLYDHSRASMGDIQGLLKTFNINEQQVFVALLHYFVRFQALSASSSKKVVFGHYGFNLMANLLSRGRYKSLVNMVQKITGVKEMVINIKDSMLSLTIGPWRLWDDAIPGKMSNHGHLFELLSENFPDPEPLILSTTPVAPAGPPAPGAPGVGPGVGAPVQPPVTIPTAYTAEDLLKIQRYFDLNSIITYIVQATYLLKLRMLNCLSLKQWNQLVIDHPVNKNIGSEAFIEASTFHDSVLFVMRLLEYGDFRLTEGDLKGLKTVVPADGTPFSKLPENQSVKRCILDMIRYWIGDSKPFYINAMKLPDTCLSFKRIVVMSLTKTIWQSLTTLERDPFLPYLQLVFTEVPEKDYWSLSLLESEVVGKLPLIELNPQAYLTVISYHPSWWQFGSSDTLPVSSLSQIEEILKKLGMSADQYFRLRDTIVASKVVTPTQKAQLYKALENVVPSTISFVGKTLTLRKDGNIQLGEFETLTIAPYPSPESNLMNVWNKLSPEQQFQVFNLVLSSTDNKDLLKDVLNLLLTSHPNPMTWKTEHLKLLPTMLFGSPTQYVRFDEVFTVWKTHVTGVLNSASQAEFLSRMIHMSEEPTQKMTDQELKFWMFTLVQSTFDLLSKDLKLYIYHHSELYVQSATLIDLSISNKPSTAVPDAMIVFFSSKDVTATQIKSFVNDYYPNETHQPALFFLIKGLPVSRTAIISSLGAFLNEPNWTTYIQSQLTPESTLVLDFSNDQHLSGLKVKTTAGLVLFDESSHWIDKMTHAIQVLWSRIAGLNSEKKLEFLDALINERNYPAGMLYLNHAEKSLIQTFLNKQDPGLLSTINQNYSITYNYEKTVVIPLVSNTEDGRMKISASDALTPEGLQTCKVNNSPPQLYVLYELLHGSLMLQSKLKDMNYYKAVQGLFSANPQLNSYLTGFKSLLVFHMAEFSFWGSNAFENLRFWFANYYLIGYRLTKTSHYISYFDTFSITIILSHTSHALPLKSIQVYTSANEKTQPLIDTLVALKKLNKVIKGGDVQQTPFEALILELVESSLVPQDQMDNISTALDSLVLTPQEESTPVYYDSPDEDVIQIVPVDQKVTTTTAATSTHDGSAESLPFAATIPASSLPLVSSTSPIPSTSAPVTATEDIKMDDISTATITTTAIETTDTTTLGSITLPEASSPLPESENSSTKLGDNGDASNLFASCWALLSMTFVTTTVLVFVQF